MAVAFHQKLEIEHCFRYAAAVATANALTPTAGNVKLEDIESLLPRVQTYKL
jgi:fructose-1-phosphate kinase PfkB-like protein